MRRPPMRSVSLGVTHGCWYGTWCLLSRCFCDPWQSRRHAMVFLNDSEKGQGVLGPAASIVLPDVPEPRLYATWVFLKIMENTEGHWTMVRHMAWSFARTFSSCVGSCVLCLYHSLVTLFASRWMFLFFCYFSVSLPTIALQCHGELPKFVVCIGRSQIPLYVHTAPAYTHRSLSFLTSHSRRWTEEGSAKTVEHITDLIEYMHKFSQDL